MDGLPVRQQNNPKIAIFHFRNLYPAPNSAICLDIFANGRPNGPFDPCVLNDTASGRTRVASKYEVVLNTALRLTNRARTLTGCLRKL
jgi:hypothetical protein